MYTVMIVEDEYLVRTGIKATIADSGLPLHLTGVVSDGLDAYNLVINSPPDILIIDLLLPGLNGIELIRRVKEADCKCKILVISCLEDFETQQEAISLGISGYLFKATMTAQELKTALEHILQELKPEAAIEELRPEIKRVINYIDEHLEEPLHLHIMAEIAGFSPNYFSNLFTQEIGTNYIAYLTDVRLTRAKELLKNTMSSVSEIALACGFNDESYFSRCFRQKYGTSPGKWRRRTS